MIDNLFAQERSLFRRLLYLSAVRVNTERLKLLMKTESLDNDLK